VKRTHMLLAGLLAGAVSLASTASAQDHLRAAGVARAAKVQVRNSGVGRILTTASGQTLYRFTKDPRNKDTCAAISGCAKIWPPYTTSGHASAGSGARASLLSTIRLPSGARQVTYAGHPLYLYAESREPLSTYYLGATQFGGTWYAVNAAGGVVK